MGRRFEYVMFDGFIDNKNYEKEYISPHEVANILNEQHETIEQLKQQLADVDRLIDDLGHDEMRRQYEEIFIGDVE